jgi:hypothetical protein
MTGRKTPRHHTGHTEPIRTPALRHSIDGNHPELREGQEDSALTAVRYAILVVLGRPYLTPNWPF